MKSLAFFTLLLLCLTAKAQHLNIPEIKQVYIRQSDNRDIYLSERGWQLIHTQGYDEQEDAEEKVMQWAHSYEIAADSTEKASGWLELHTRQGGEGTYLKYGPMSEQLFNYLRKSALSIYGNPKVISLDIQGTATKYNAGLYDLMFLKTIGRDSDGIPVNSYLVFFQKKKL